MSITTDEEALAAAQLIDRQATAVARKAALAQAAALAGLSAAHAAHHAALAGAVRLDAVRAMPPSERTPRQAALAAGQNRYIGEPCDHGHVPPVRYVQSSRCVACVRVTEAKSEHRRARKAARRKAKARILGWDKVK
jgi:hypothetical protein